MKRFKRFIFEAALTGKRRGGRQEPNWDHYVVLNYDKTVEYSLEAKGNLELTDIKSGELILKLRPTDKVKILDTKLTKKGSSKYASVSFRRKKGLLNLNAITKPTGKTRPVGSVIGGGKNSKEFTPDKLSLGGSEYSNVNSLVSDVSSKITNVYGGEEFAEIRRYLSEVVHNITGISMLSEKAPRYGISFKPKGSYDVTDADMKIISKNFGEVIGAMYLLKSNKKMKVIGFPGAMNEGLYDIYGKDDKGRMHYYSAKSAGGSSTSMANLDFIRRNFSYDNTFLQNHMEEMEVIDSLTNVEGEYNTVYNITAFFNDNLKKKIKEMLAILNDLSMPNLQIGDVEQATLDEWFPEIKENSTEDEFVKTMNKLYNSVLGDLKGTPKTSEKVLREMFNSKSNFHHGYLLYPMGSYIVKYLNNTPKYIEALNLLADFGSFISQITVDMSLSITEIQIIKFSRNEFRFSYNGMSKAPGNRPIGFKEA